MRKRGKGVRHEWYRINLQATEIQVKKTESGQYGEGD